MTKRVLLLNFFCADILKFAIISVKANFCLEFLFLKSAQKQSLKLKLIYFK